MSSHKILNIHPPIPELKNRLSQELRISAILSQVLINRGIRTSREAESFLNVRLSDLGDPFMFADMHKAVDLIRKASRDKERIMVCGDYDVDGITALALLLGTLSKIGAEAVHYVPHRIKDGYGLNRKVVEIAKEKNIKLVITVDCGTSSFEVIEELRKNNIEVIVTDHHEPSVPVKPAASAFINSKLNGSCDKYSVLAGVGVAYKLCQALTGKKLIEDLDLVALGTIADVVPLTGENRIIAKEGLNQLAKGSRMGIKALAEVARIKQEEINSTYVSFILGPRINASGRVATAQASLDLLMSRDKAEACTLARSIDGYNRQRQKIESKILQEAQDLIEKEVNFKEHKIICVAKDGWHQGVLGIVASKLADRFYRPAIVISVNEGLCKGSGRSIKNFHLFGALTECKGLLQSFGGHSHAVGLSVAKDNIAPFKDQINRVAKERLSLEDLLPSFDIDIELGLLDAGAALADELKELAPFGTGNPEPLFFSRNLKLKGEPQVLGRDTLKFWITDTAATRQAIAFGMGSLKNSLMNAQSLDLVYTLGTDDWDQDSVILRAKDIFLR